MRLPFWSSVNRPIGRRGSCGKLREAALEATRKLGVGSGAVRTIAGTVLGGALWSLPTDREGRFLPGPAEKTHFVGTRLPLFL